MIQTSKGMIQNFLTLVQRFGFVPNGGRIYYSKRSQPPFLISMSDVYYEHTKDTQFILDNLNILEQEYNFWYQNRTVAVTLSGSSEQKTFFRYHANSNSLRPEGYREDAELTKGMSKGG